jgi:hypothetical protein
MAKQSVLKEEELMPTLPAPTIEHEIVVGKCFNDNRAISLTIGTARALKWVKAAGCYFDNFTRITSLSWISVEDLPKNIIVQVSEVYDFNEVFDYLASIPGASVKEKE